MRTIRLLFAMMLAASLYPACAQILGTSVLTGKYFARHVEFTGSGTVTDARSIIGVITWNGNGQYSFTGQQVIGTASAASFTASGAYSVSAAGVVTLSNPQNSALSINGRYGVEAVVGSSTEAGDDTFDLFVAVPAPTSPDTVASAKGTYYAADFELPGASFAQVRDSFLSLTLDGAANITAGTVSGHAANLSSGAVLSQGLNGASYFVNGDGSGTLALTGASLVSSAPRTMYTSKSGNVLLAGTPGGHDLFIAVKAIAGSASNSGLTQSFWLGGLRVDTSGGNNSYAGSGETINGASITSTERLHEAGAAGGLNVTASETYTVASDGTGSYGSAKIGLGTGGGLMTMASVNAQLDPTGYEISLALANQTLTSAGVFVNPRGVVNAASGAPGVDAISPGEFVAIYGSGLAGSTVSSLPPYPASLGNVSVSIGGMPAPIYFVSAGQIDCLVPFGVSGTSVSIAVTNNGVVSNTVTVPLAKTSPGAFSLDTSGTGDGAITHLDGSVVNAASPAVKGEIVVLYLTGLGALTTPVADGQGATAADSALTSLALFVNGSQVPAANVLYAGMSSLAGLYQINFRVPTTLTNSGELPLAILTPEAFHDQVSISVR